MDILKALFDGDIRPLEQSGKLTSEASKLMKQTVKVEEHLLALLDEKSTEALRAYQSSREEVNYLVMVERFKDAFILGARLMMEICNEEKGKKDI